VRVLWQKYSVCMAQLGGGWYLYVKSVRNICAKIGHLETYSRVCMFFNDHGQINFNSGFFLIFQFALSTRFKLDRFGTVSGTLVCV